MANYYVNSSSTGTGDGTTTATTGVNAAFKTIAEVNAATFAAGDSILFNRGQTWREQLVPDSGSVSGHITYGAYGLGNKPLLLGSVTKNLTGDWTDQTGNLWKTATNSFLIDVGNLIFNNEASCGIKQMSATPTLDTQGDFWYDFDNNSITMYSVGNPATFYTNIECALRQNAVELGNGQDYVILDGLDIRYAGSHAVGCIHNDNIIIRNNHISFIGGGDAGNNYSYRYGNGIEFAEGATNCLAEKNVIDNCFDTTTTSQGGGANHIASNVIFRNNICSNSEMLFEYWQKGTGANVDSVYFENNTCINAGSGWGHNQRPDSQGRSLALYASEITPTNIYVRNNIFYGSTDYVVFIQDATAMAGVTVDYNCYYPTSGNIFEWDWSSYTFTNYKIATSQDAHSISADPLFISTSDFHLQSGSPAINAGVTIATVTDDYDGVSRTNNTYDIGAYEMADIKFFIGVSP